MTVTKVLGLLVLFLTLASGLCRAEEDAVRPDLASKYRLNTGDLIRIVVFGEQDLTVEAKLTDAGTISYPFLGEILVKGMTIGELSDRITEELKGPYLKNPQVSVNIIQYRDFFVNGEIAKPGSYPYVPGLTVQKAVAIAGGYTERASRTKLHIIREDKPDEEIEVGPADRVAPGDILVVEESFF